MTGEEFDAEIRRLGFSQVAFASFTGITDRTARAYASKGPPPFVQVFLRLLAQSHVPGGWRGNRLKAAPTVAETREAIEPALRHVIDKAIDQHWDPATIADALSEIADELRGDHVEAKAAGAT